MLTNQISRLDHSPCDTIFQFFNFEMISFLRFKKSHFLCRCLLLNVVSSIQNRFFLLLFQTERKHCEYKTVSSNTQVIDSESRHWTFEIFYQGISHSLRFPTHCSQANRCKIFFLCIEQKCISFESVIKFVEFEIDTHLKNVKTPVTVARLFAIWLV